MSNNIYDILNKFNALEAESTETTRKNSTTKSQLKENMEYVVSESSKKLSEKWDQETKVSPEEKGKYKGKSLAQLKKSYNALKDSGPHKKGSEEYGRMRELAFAIRAKTGWGKVSEGSDLDDYYGFKKGSDDKKYTSKVHKGHYGTEYQGDSDDDDETGTKKKIAAPAGEKRGRGRPKGVKNRVLRQGEKKQVRTADTGEKRGRGRPPGSKNKAKAMEAIAEADTIILKGLRSLLEGSIQGGIWTDQPPKPGQKNVPPPVPTDPVMDKDGKIVKPAPTKPSKPAPAKPTDKRSEVDTEQGVAEAYDAMDEADMWYKVVNGRMMQRSFKHAESDMARSTGYSSSPDRALSKAGIIRSKFDSTKFVQKNNDTGKWVPVYPYGKPEQKMDEDDMEEGNAFGKAVRDAKADGVQPGEKITVGGKTYPVKESKQIDECDTLGPMANGIENQEGRISVNANMSSDGSKSITVTADGESAEELMQLLTLAGMDGNNRAMNFMKPVQGEEQPYMEEKDSRYEASTTPEEKIFPVQVQIKGGDGDVAGREKKMNKHGAARFSDNPAAAKESIEETVLSSNLMKEYNAIKVQK